MNIFRIKFIENVNLNKKIFKKYQHLQSDSD